MLVNIRREMLVDVMDRIVHLVALSLIFMLAASANAGMFFDDFNDGDADGWIVLTGTWEVIDGEYHMPVAVKPPDPPQPITFALDGKEFGEFTMEAKLRNDEFHPEGNQSHTGFAFGMDKEGSGYFLYFRYHKGVTCATGSVTLRWGFAGGSEGWDPNADIAEACDVFDPDDQGNWHVLKAEVSDAKRTLKIWVDGEEAMEVELEKSAAGKLGFWAGRIGAGSFDDVSITGPSIPASSVEPTSSLLTVWGGIKIQYY